MSKLPNQHGTRGAARLAGAPWAAGLLVALAAVACFLTAVPNGFVYDDRVLIERHPGVQGEGPLTDLWLSPYHPGPVREVSGLYRPLVLTSYRLEWSLWNGNPRGFHGDNVWLHALVSLLVLVVARRLGVPPSGAFAAALLFAVHPVHVEAVANLAGRAELLAALGCLASVAAWSTLSGWRGAAVAGLLWLGALLSKEHAYPWAAVLAAWTFVASQAGEGPPGAWTAAWRRARPVVLAVALAAAAALVLRAVALGGPFRGPAEVSFVDNPVWGAPWPVRWATAAVVGLRYLVLLVFPRTLSPDYSYAHTVPVDSWRDPWIWAALAILVPLAAGAVIWARRDRRAAWAMAAAAAPYLLISNVFVPIGTIMAERLLYLPSFGLAVLAGLAFAGAARRWPRTSWAVLLVVSLVLGARTASANRVWKDDATLWSYAYTVAPSSVKVLQNLAAVRLRQGEPAAAVELLRRALRLAPDHVLSRLNLAQAYLSLGRWDEAAEQLQWLEARIPNDPGVRMARAQWLASQGEPEQALAILGTLESEGLSSDLLPVLTADLEARTGRPEAAEARLRARLAARPEDVGALTALASVLEAQGRWDEAARAYEEIARRSGESAPVLANLARARWLAGDPAAALPPAERAVSLAPESPTAWKIYAQVLEALGRFPQAGEAWKRARVLRPGDPEAAAGRARVLVRMGKSRQALDELRGARSSFPDDPRLLSVEARALLDVGELEAARQAYERLVRLQPDASAAWNNLGVVRARLGDLDGAAKAWRRALELRPGSEEILRNLRRLDAGRSPGPPSS